VLCIDITSTFAPLRGGSQARLAPDLQDLGLYTRRTKGRQRARGLEREGHSHDCHRSALASPDLMAGVPDVGVTSWQRQPARPRSSIRRPVVLRLAGPRMGACEAGARSWAV